MKDQIVQLNQRPSPPSVIIPKPPSSTVLPCSECVVHQQNIAKLTQKLQDVSEKYESARDGGNNIPHFYLFISFHTLYSTLCHIYKSQP